MKNNNKKKKMYKSCYNHIRLPREACEIQEQNRRRNN